MIITRISSDSFHLVSTIQPPVKKRGLFYFLTVVLSPSYPLRNVKNTSLCILFFLLPVFANGESINFLYMAQAGFVTGLIIPIRLGTISIMRMMIGMHINNNLLSVIILSTVVGIPFGVFMLTDFIKMIPEELSNAARIDGCSEPGIFRIVIIPLLKPALAAVAIVNFMPVWNDFWFPLVLLKDDAVRTVPLAADLLFGQYLTNYGLVFTVLSMASIPVIIVYLVFSKQFIKGLSSGALKG